MISHVPCLWKHFPNSRQSNTTTSEKEELKGNAWTDIIWLIALFFALIIFFLAYKVNDYFKRR